MENYAEYHLFQVTQVRKKPYHQNPKAENWYWPKTLQKDLHQCLHIVTKMILLEANLQLNLCSWIFTLLGCLLSSPRLIAPEPQPISRLFRVEDPIVCSSEEMISDAICTRFSVSGLGMKTEGLWDIFRGKPQKSHSPKMYCIGIR